MRSRIQIRKASEEASSPTLAQLNRGSYSYIDATISTHIYSTNATEALASEVTRKDFPDWLLITGWLFSVRKRNYSTCARELDSAQYDDQNAPRSLRCHPLFLWYHCDSFMLNISDERSFRPANAKRRREHLALL